MLKIIALLLMLIDHIGLLFFNNIMIYRIIGRLSMPIFAFCLSRGFIYTKNKKKYILRMILLSLISEPFFYLMSGIHFNVIFDLSLSLISLYYIEQEKIVGIIISIIFIIFSFLIGIEYNFYLIILSLIFYYLFFQKKNIISLITLYLLITLIYSFISNEIYELFALFALPIILLLNKYDKEQKINKYFFYYFYPLHMLVLILIKALTK